MAIPTTVPTGVFPISTTRQQALRVLDANANRAAEGLRTLEDVARLIREDAAAAEIAKSLRHRLTAALASLPRRERLASRSTASDAGTELTTPGESQRADEAAIVSSACERVAQALRQLEEFGKVLGGPFASEIKQLRYVAYDDLARLELALGRPVNPFEQARLYLLIDCSQPLPQFCSYVEQLSEAGVDAFQLRDKQADGQRLLEYARGLQATLATRPAITIVNDRVDIALAAGVDAVHVGQDDLPLPEVRRLAGESLWVGISTHDLQQAQQAQAAGADYIGCGPTFPSQTKHFEQFPGPEFLSQVAVSATIPYFAIGGIQLDNLNHVLAAGCRRVCVSGAIHSADNPHAAAREIKTRLLAEQP